MDIYKPLYITHKLLYIITDASSNYDNQELSGCFANGPGHLHDITDTFFTLNTSHLTAGETYTIEVTVTKGIRTANNSLRLEVATGTPLEIRLL